MTDAERNERAEIDRLNLELTAALWRETDLAGRLDALTAERDRLAGFVEALCERCAAQAEMLGRAAEWRGSAAARIAELEAAVGPVVQETMGTGWDSGALPATVHYPVKIGHLRALARAYAGIGRPAA